MNPVIIAIDGEASTGKSTQAKKIAKELNFNYRDSGAYYRAITLYLIQNNINSKEDIPQTILDEILIKQVYKDNNLIISLNNEDVSEKIRGYRVSIKVSSYAKKSEIRNFVYKQLRNSAKSNSLVIDGRDIGSVVFKRAFLKLYVDVDVNIRAKRRYKQLIDNGEKSIYLKILKDIKLRDKTDKTRKNSPLVVPKGAKIINNSHTFKKTIAQIRNIIEGIN